jgi:hypothetical protein
LFAGEGSAPVSTSIEVDGAKNRSTGGRMRGSGETQQAARCGAAIIALAALLGGQMSLRAAAESPARPYLSNPLASSRPAGAAMPATDPACKPVFDASDKLLTTDSHMYMTHTSDGKSTTTELIVAGGARYVMVGGKWTRSPMTAESLKAQEEENKKNAKIISCRQVGNEVVSGETAVVYTEHSETEDSKNDAKIWISKSKGLILKEELDLGTGPGADHMAIRYEYSNVHPPAI